MNKHINTYVTSGLSESDEYEEIKSKIIEGLIGNVRLQCTEHNKPLTFKLDKVL